MALPAESVVRVLVVEDEPLYAEQLEAALQDLGYEPVGPAADARIALALHRTETIDLALLDVNLRGSVDGIALAAQLLAHRPIPIVFLTSLTDGATFTRAQNTGPAAFLTKPVELAALGRALALAVHNFGQHQSATPAPAAEPLPVAPLPDALFVKENGLLEKIRLSNVQSVMAEDKLCCLTLAERTVHVRMALRELVQYLPPERFVQIQRSYYVNIEHIERLDPVRHLLQVGKQLLPVSRLYQDELLRRLRTIG
ncbi:response regulator transcription factor [Microvirga sp. STS02]|uniref:LytR/AlgR family response regulator transcription factor n=1 Tax=Hymenobacter negativus TaxID=2795026 RepID=UPI0018DD8DCD|nr:MULTISPECIES: response regulator transcription factor [Bacteria]MBH8570343.1 response regulator transcription factor [Hymenobacter negativus]MBR7210082.1 response regulator transcription factor [Microvirga sp. STS02]